MAIWGTHFLPAGVASVFGSAAPVFLALFAWVFLRELPGRRQVAGIALGLAGLAAMAWLSSSGAGLRPIGAVMTLVASATWAGGSLVAARLRIPDRREHVGRLRGVPGAEPRCVAHPRQQLQLRRTCDRARTLCLAARRTCWVGQGRRRRCDANRRGAHDWRSTDRGTSRTAHRSRTRSIPKPRT